MFSHLDKKIASQTFERYLYKTYMAKDGYPSGNLLEFATEHGPCTVDFSIEHADFPQFFVCLPEDTPLAAVIRPGTELDSIYDVT